MSTPRFNEGDKCTTVGSNMLGQSICVKAEFVEFLPLGERSNVQDCVVLCDDGVKVRTLSWDLVKG